MHKSFLLRYSYLYVCVCVCVCVYQPLCGAYNELAKTYSTRKVEVVHFVIIKYREAFQSVGGWVRGRGRERWREGGRDGGREKER